MIEATDLEKKVLGACLVNAVKVEDLRLTKEMFYLPSHQIIFDAILKCGCDLASVTQYLMDTGTLDKIGGVIPLTELTDYISSNGQAYKHARIIEQKYITRQSDVIFQNAQKRCTTAEDIADIIDDVKTKLTDLIPDHQKAIYINPLAELTEPPVYCKINGCPSMTAGNFSLINGKAKSGKTFFLGAIVAGMLNNSKQIEKIEGCLPEDKKNVLYFDTEQSTYHATRTVKRICALTGNPNPSNLIPYGLRPLTPAERLQTIENIMSKTENLGVVAIDGIRDLLSIGINDEAEATSLTSKFLRWTSEYNMHLILLLHQNKTDLNARGHIGTEILNKAETTLTVSKDKSNVFIVSCEYSRDVPFNDFGFIIGDGAIVSSDLPQESIKATKNPQHVDKEKHFEALDNIFKNRQKIASAEFPQLIKREFGNIFGDNICRNFITHYLESKWIDKIKEKREVYYVYNRASF